MLAFATLAGGYSGAWASPDSSSSVLECRTRVEMGTDFKICVYTEPIQRLNLEIDFRESFKILNKIDLWMSEWKPETELSRVNQAAGAKPVAVSKELFAVLNQALEVSQKTQGAFDPTFNVFWGLYNFKPGQESEPADTEIAERLPLINYKNVEIRSDTRSVFLKKPGMKLGLGGIGQGYGVDAVAEHLKARGYKAGFVDGSGDTYFWGKKPSGELWTAGIRDPRNHDQVIARIYGTDFAITTSGDDEKFFMKNGRRVHHIIDPKTGKPSQASRQATVIARKAVNADVYDTASFVLGPQKAKAVLEKQGFEGILIGASGEVAYTKGLKKDKTSWGEVMLVPKTLK